LDIFKFPTQAVTSVKKVILFFIGAQLAKSIHTNDKSLEITPTIAAHAGSQYFIKNITNLIA
jgi:hypothetical protein